MKLKLKVIPGSSQNSIVGWLGDALKIKVKAPPEKGKANQAVEKILAASLNLPSKEVRIITGQTQANKIAEIQVLTVEEVLFLLKAPVP